MEVYYSDGTTKKQHGELKDLLKEAELELKKEDVRSVKIVKSISENSVPKIKPRNTFPKKRRKRK